MMMIILHTTTTTHRVTCRDKPLALSLSLSLASKTNDLFLFAGFCSSCDSSIRNLKYKKLMLDMILMNLQLDEGIQSVGAWVWWRQRLNQYKRTTQYWERERESWELENNFVVIQFTSKLFKQKTNALANARELWHKDSAISWGKCP